MAGINYGSIKFKDMRIYQTETNSKNFVTATQTSYINKEITLEMITVQKLMQRLEVESDKTPFVIQIF
jgi:hypothetical protein